MIMNRSLKRYRQTSILESIFVSKRGKGECSCKASDMEKDANEKLKTEIREKLASAAESRAASAKGSYSETTCNDSSSGSSSSTIVYESQTESSSFSQNSDDLFPEENSATSSVTKERSSCSTGANLTNGETSKKLKALWKFNRLPKCQQPLPSLVSSATHTVLFRHDLHKDGVAPPPYPTEYSDKWDSDHVRMPCSAENLCPVLEEDGSKSIRSRWELIEKSLLSDIKSSYDLQEAIMQYNSHNASRWDFSGFHAFFAKLLDENERELFFMSTLPGMVRLALQLPQICTRSIPLLKCRKTHSITMSQKQIGCLLSNAFLCTFPRRTITSKQIATKQGTEYKNYPDINFNRLYVGTKNEISQRSAEKLKCLINYFHRITKKEPTGTVTFHRKYLQYFPDWSISQCAVRNIAVDSSGVIENEGFGMLQVDFANKYVGGGVLSFGCVQEEIRFVICPELIVSRLFTEALGPEEVLVITGVEQYNNYSGYGNSFKWDGDFQDNVVRDSWGRRCTQMVAMDALYFRNAGDQFKTMYVERELNKAYCGFFEDNIPPENLPTIATGNWGCGVYKGNNILKFLIQLMAASESRRDMLYFTFHNPKLQKEIEDIHSLIVEKNFRVGDLWTLILKYVKDPSRLRRPSFFKHVLENLLDTNPEQKSLDEMSSIVDSFNDMKAMECMLNDPEFEIEM